MAKTQTTTPRATPMTVSHVEFNTSDTATLRKTFETVFGWKFETITMPGAPPYHMTRTANGNGVAVTEPQPGQPTVAIPYVSVDDIEATFKKTKKATGVEIIAPVTPVPNMGTFFLFRTKGGPVVGVWQDASQN